MRSTIKIDYDRSHELKPVIKIICPTNAGLSNWEMESGVIDEDDPRDKLVRDFLWTPRNIVENYLFEINQRMEINDGKLLLTTIAAIPEEDIFQRLKTAINGRIIGDNYERISEYYSYRKNHSAEMRQMPDNYDRWLKITEFFEWLEKQPYSGNTFKETELLIDGTNQRADNAYSAGFTPQTDRTLRDYFETELFAEVRDRAFKITPKLKLDMYLGTLSQEPFQLILTVDDNIFDRAYYEKHFDAGLLEVFDDTKIGDTIDVKFNGKPWVGIRIL